MRATFSLVHCIIPPSMLSRQLTYILSLLSLLSPQLKPYVAPTVFKYPSDAGIAWPPLKKKSTFFGI